MLDKKPTEGGFAHSLPTGLRLASSGSHYLALFIDKYGLCWQGALKSADFTHAGRLASAGPVAYFYGTCSFCDPPWGAYLAVSDSSESAILYEVNRTTSTGCATSLQMQRLVSISGVVQVKFAFDGYILGAASNGTHYLVVALASTGKTILGAMVKK